MRSKWSIQTRPQQPSREKGRFKFFLLHKDPFELDPINPSKSSQSTPDIAFYLARNLSCSCCLRSRARSLIIPWQALAEVHLAKAIRSQGKAAKLAREDIFDVTRTSRSGMSGVSFLAVQSLLMVWNSRNCTKHNCRCDYMDCPAPPEEPARYPTGPNLLWTPRIEREIEAWQRTGVFPFLELNIRSFQHFRGLSAVDLRLVYHLSSIHRDMHSSNFAQCTLWVQLIPRYENALVSTYADRPPLTLCTSFLDAAIGYDFVMSSILAFSATSLGYMTNSTETKNLAYYHGGVALKGLHGAIGRFSRENSDAVLAASILLSWQAADW